MTGMPDIGKIAFLFSNYKWKFVRKNLLNGQWIWKQWMMKIKSTH